MSNSGRYIYHFTERETYQSAQSQGFYKPRSFEKDGFIHCSNREQVLHVANFIAPKDGDLLLLEIDTEKVKAEIIHENLEGGDRLFPHIYGPLHLLAITKVWKFALMNNEFVFPGDTDLMQPTS